VKPGVRLGLLLAGLLVVTWSIGFYAIATFTFVLGIPPGPILLGVSAFLFVILYHRLGGSRDPSHLRILVGLGLVLAIASVVLGNGMTDEWATTPRYAQTLLAGHDFYTTPTRFTYVQVLPFLQYSTRVSVTYDNYLPLLTFLQVPGLDYRYFSIGCWLVMVYLVRKDFFAAFTLGQPLVALYAANGFNDLVVLLLLTLAFVGFEGRKSRVAQLLALGAKQFANVFVFLYYLVKRDLRGMALTVLGTLAFLLPFLVWDWSATLCNAGLAAGDPSCLVRGGYFSIGEFLDHANYWLWPLWAAALYHRPVLAFLRSHPRWPGAIRLYRWLTGHSPEAMGERAP
jgi:hypothetical protein